MRVPVPFDARSCAAGDAMLAATSLRLVDFGRILRRPAGTTIK